MTRQRAYQLRMAAAGRCVKCGRACNLFRGYCDEHGIYDRRRMRLRTGSHAQRPGHPGRPRLDNGKDL